MMVTFVPIGPADGENEEIVGTPDEIEAISESALMILALALKSKMRQAKIMMNPKLTEERIVLFRLNEPLHIPSLETLSE
jgi:hypothetical protein